MSRVRVLTVSNLAATTLTACRSSEDPKALIQTPAVQTTPATPIDVESPSELCGVKLRKEVAPYEKSIAAHFNRPITCEYRLS